MEHETIKSDDCREYFRLNDEVLLDYARVDEAQVAALRERIFDRTVDRFTVAATFATSSRTMSRILSSFSSNQPDLARYLKQMDQKLNQLARLFVIEEMNATEHAVTRVNLSAGGLAFPSATEFTPGEMLQIRLALLPAMTGILAVGSVVYCERSPQSNGLPWQVAVKYEYIRESDRDLICSHMMSREAERLRLEREDGGEGPDREGA